MCNNTECGKFCNRGSIVLRRHIGGVAVQLGWEELLEKAFWKRDNISIFVTL